MKQLYEIVLVRRIEQIQHATLNVEAATEEEAREIALQTPAELIEWSEAIKDLPVRDLKVGEVEILAEVSD